MTATTAGFRISVRGRRIYLVDTEPTSDPGISAAEAREIAARLLTSAAVVERQHKEHRDGRRYVQ
jgi:hypothetical protein